MLNFTFISTHTSKATQVRLCATQSVECTTISLWESSCLPKATRLGLHWCKITKQCRHNGNIHYPIITRARLCSSVVEVLECKKGQELSRHQVDCQSHDVVPDVRALELPAKTDINEIINGAKTWFICWPIIATLWSIESTPRICQHLSFIIRKCGYDHTLIHVMTYRSKWG